MIRAASTTLVPVRGALTLDDLEQLAFTYGGTIEALPGNRYRLVGAVMDGRRINLGPVSA